MFYINNLLQSILYKERFCNDCDVVHLLDSNAFIYSEKIFIYSEKNMMSFSVFSPLNSSTLHTKYLSTVFHTM